MTQGHQVDNSVRISFGPRVLMGSPPYNLEPTVAPFNVSARSLSASEVQVFWEAIPWETNKGKVRGYEVRKMIYVINSEGWKEPV